MQKTITVATILCVAMMLNFGSFFACGNDDRFERELEPIIQELIKQQDIPGLALAIVEKRQVLYAKAFGIQSLADASNKVTTRSLFQMASVTKPFVATGVLQLIEDGKIEFDTAAVKYLPHFKMGDERYKQITVRHLLSHTAGIPHLTDYEYYNPQFDEGALKRFVGNLNNLTLIAAPGTKYQYSNIGYDILGNLIAEVSGLSFEHYIEKQILIPLGMNSSTLLLKQADSELLTSPHVLDSLYSVVVNEFYPYNRIHAPSGALYSNLSDMTQWALVNVNRGEINGNRILKDSTYDIMWTSTNDDWKQMGISWFIGEHQGHQTISHSGGTIGYGSFLIMIPSKSLAVIVMSNYERAAVIDLAKTALDVALGFPAKPISRAVNLELDRILYKDILENGRDAAIQKYYSLKETANPKFDFTQVLQLNKLATNLINQNRLMDGIEIFKLNVAAYPKMAWLYNNLAEAQLQNGDRKLAIMNYEKALQLNPKNQKAAASLQKLRKD